MNPSSLIGRVGCALLFLFTLIPPAAFAYTIDTSVLLGPVTGLWWNPNESGWGATVTQEYGTIFVAMYTYDTGNPVWYVATNCPVSGTGCTGALYKVTGGTRPTSPWNGAALNVASVGSLSVTFSDANNGTMNFTINGEPGSKTITRQVFASPPTAGPALYQGTYSGTYTGSDSGTWVVTIDSVGYVSGIYHSTLYGDGPVSGAVSSIGALAFTASGFSGPATFSGTLSASGAASGTWIVGGTNEGGSFSGQKQ